MTKSNHTPLPVKFPELKHRFHGYVKNESAPGGAVGMYEVFDAETGKTQFTLGIDLGLELDGKKAALIVHRVNNWDKLVEAFARIEALTLVTSTSPEALLDQLAAIRLSSLAAQGFANAREKTGE